MLLRFAQQVSSIRNTTSSLNMYLGFKPGPEPEPEPSALFLVEVSLSLLELPCYPRTSFRITLFYNHCCSCLYTDTGIIPGRCSNNRILCWYIRIH